MKNLINLMEKMALDLPHEKLDHDDFLILFLIPVIGVFL